MCLSWPDECKLFVGTDRGAIACIDITVVVESARRQREEILRRKESGEAAEVISGRIFDSLPRPVNSPEYVFTLESNWKVEKAHSLSVESIFFCQRQPSVLMTLGADNCLRIWDHATGEPLGSLEQGLPEGLIYERSTEWSFPLDPYLQIQSDTTALIEASEVEMGEGDAGDTKLRRLSENQTMPSGRQMEDHITELVKKDRRRSLLQSSSCPALASKGKQLSEFLAAPTQDFSHAEPRYLQNRRDQKTEDWYAGSFARSFALPKLESGLNRPPEPKKLVEAARQLAKSLGLGRKSSDVP
ncbi:unnamed protein product [Durusdinium trenchii]|uniref:Uncharacterized protein n=1 Tax=Durusdinium trenchii TaxID=1381693 RepID=A0ABP0S074_9DINO